MSAQTQLLLENAHSKNSGSLKHLRHESRHAFQLAVTGTDSAKYRIEDWDAGFGARNKAACLRHKSDDANLMTGLPLGHGMEVRA